jgi:hypothetical protein
LKRRDKIFWLAVGAVFVIGFLWLIPFHGEICKETAKANEENCPTYRVPPFVVIWVGKILDAMGGGITALATIAIAWFTLTLRRSTDRLWDAGERQLSYLSDTADRQLRAYVHVKGATVQKIDKPSERVIKVRIENFGQTPAKDVVFRSGEHVREWPLTTEFGGFPADLSTSPSPLAPRNYTEMMVPVSPLSAWEEQELQAGRAGIYVWGEITYIDCFDQPRRTWFCFVCEGEGLPGGRMHATEQGNGYT